MSTTRQAAISRSNSRAAQEDRERLSDVPGAKACTLCLASKPLAAFSPGNGRYGRRSRCKVCRALVECERGRSEAAKATRRAWAARPDVKARHAAASRKWEGSPKGQAALARRKEDFRHRLLQSAGCARYRLRRTGTDRSREILARSLWRIGREIARIDRQREIA